MKKVFLYSMLMIGCVVLATGQSHISMRVPHTPSATHQMAPEAMAPPIQAVQEFLDLTVDQVKKWQDLQQAKHDQMDAQREQTQTLEQQLQEQLKSANPAPASVG